MERVKGIEPSYAAWEAAVLPLNYTRTGDGLSVSRGGLPSVEGECGGRSLWFDQQPERLARAAQDAVAKHTAVLSVAKDAETAVRRDRHTSGPSSVRAAQDAVASLAN